MDASEIIVTTDPETTITTTPLPFAGALMDQAPSAVRPVVYYHIGTGRGGAPWREAVAAVPVGAGDEEVAAIRDTVAKLEEAFPLPPAFGGINSWYNNEFVAAYLAVSTASRLQAMLVAMGSAKVANPGEVVIGWGKKYPAETIASVVKKDPQYLEWVREQGSGNLDAVRIITAADAYRVVNEGEA